MLNNWVTENKDVIEEQKRDSLLPSSPWKYTQSNSVRYTYNGQTIGVGAGQQSCIHCTRLAGQRRQLAAAPARQGAEPALP